MFCRYGLLEIFCSTEAIIKIIKISVFRQQKFQTLLCNGMRLCHTAETQRTEFVLLASLGVVSAILGLKTKIKIREGSTNRNARNPRKAYVEYPGLFLTILSEAGSRKSTAHQLAHQLAV